jgi:hypothetical protein
LYADDSTVGKKPRKPHHAPPFLPAYATAGGEKTLPIPGYRQARNYSCGFATTLMVARYFRSEVDARELFLQLGTGRDGTRQSAIVKALRAWGVGANVRYDVGFARLRREIGRGKLVVGYLHDAEHWVLLYGFGLEPERVFVADPEPGESCVQPWEPYRERLRDFGIVCSARRRGQTVAMAADPISLAERREARERERERAASARPHEDPPVQLSFAFVRRGR